MLQISKIVLPHTTFEIHHIYRAHISYMEAFFEWVNCIFVRDEINNVISIILIE